METTVLHFYFFRKFLAEEIVFASFGTILFNRRHLSRQFKFFEKLNLKIVALKIIYSDKEREIYAQDKSLT